MRSPSLSVIYVSPNSVGAPLVRSQVLPYLRGLMERGVRFHLVTFERGEPYPDGEFPRERWHPLRPVPGEHLLAKIADAVRGCAALLAVAVCERAALVHARSYLPAAIAVVVATLLRRPYVFDMRGFLGEEYVDAGHWSSSDLRYRALRLAEGILLRRAAGIVVLTEVAADRLRNEPRYAGATARKPVLVVPCAVDVQRFHPRSERSATPTVVYAGSLGMWYLLDEMLRVFCHARELLPRLRFLILNRNEHDLIGRTVERTGLADGVDVRRVPYDEMPQAVSACHVGIALLRRAPSKTGSSPVKIAEYLACGLPVIVNEGLGDTDRLVTRYAAGHVVSSYEDDELRRAARALVTLLEDDTARANARHLAEQVYDVRVATERYRGLYEQLTGWQAG